MGMIGGMLDDVLADLLLAAAKQQVVVREICVAEHVGGDQDVVRQTIARGDERVPGIAGKDDLEQTRIAHVPLYQLIDIARTKGPMRHAHRQAVHRHLGHEAVGYRLEYHRVPLETQAMRQFFELGDVGLPAGAHATLPASAACASALKKCRTAVAMSSLLVTENRPVERPAAVISSNSRMVSVRTVRSAFGEIST